MIAKAGSKPPDVIYFGQPESVWVAWAESIQEPLPLRPSRSFFKRVHQLSLDRPDEWAAFVAAQRMEGNKVWDTGAT